MRSENKDLVRWVEVGDVVSSDVVPEPCKTTMVTSVGSQDVTEGGSAARSGEPGSIMRWRLTVATDRHSLREGGKGRCYSSMWVCFMGAG